MISSDANGNSIIRLEFLANFGKLVEKMNMGVDLEEESDEEEEDEELEKLLAESEKQLKEMESFFNGMGKFLEEKSSEVKKKGKDASFEEVYAELKDKIAANYDFSQDDDGEFNIDDDEEMEEWVDNFPELPRGSCYLFREDEKKLRDKDIQRVMSLEDSAKLLQERVVKVIFEEYKRNWQYIMDDFGNHPLFRDFLPKPDHPEVVLDLVLFDVIYVGKTIKLRGECTWDMEHGISISIEPDLSVSIDFN